MKKTTSKIEKLDVFAQKAIDDIFEISDEVIMAEIKEENIDAEEVVMSIKQSYENAKSVVGKSRLAAARKNLDQETLVPESSMEPVVNIETARKFLNKIKDENNPLSKDITLAARNLDTLSDVEILSIYSDFIELGVFDERDSE